MPDPAFLTERQEKWFAAVREGLERDTGRNLEAWAALARTCPETAHRKRLAWMKTEFGLGQNRASMVLNAAFPPETGWSQPAALAETLWMDPTGRAIQEAIREKILRLPSVLIGQRKTFTAYSRSFQFCALRPLRAGAILGLAIPPAIDPLLQPPGKHGWSERLLSTLPLPTTATIPPNIDALLRAAWDAS